MSGATPRASLRLRIRRTGLGLSTLLGRPRACVIPYRYAGAAAPRPYPALERFFQAAEPAFRELLASAETLRGDILEILAGDGPARFDQDWFPRLDALAAYTLVRQAMPRRVVEIGSGHSTRFLAQAVRDGGLATEIVAIDPQPRASLARLDVRHEQALLADADPALFAALEPGDVLFVDSSHIAMPGTDVDRVVGDLLPRLPAGVLVHIHDILLPDAYPPEWTWRGYNEATVAAALIGAGGYELVFSSHWVSSRHPAWLASGIVGRLPLVPGAHETSLWLRKR